MKKTKILIVEDEPVCVLALKRSLDSSLVDIDIANDGLTALAMFNSAFAEHNPYTIIFMDIVMPKLDGATTLLQIRNFEKDQGVAEEHKVKVVIISAIDDRKTILQAVLIGHISSFLSKPIDIKKLSKVMTQLVDELK